MSAFPNFGIRHRLIASLLLAVMAMPAFAPLAFASAPPQVGMHCDRRPLASEESAAPAEHSEPSTGHSMRCHHAASRVDAATVKENSDRHSSAFAATPTSSVRSGDCCCSQNCDCCRNVRTSNWARPAPNQPAIGGVTIAPNSPVAFQQHIPSLTLRPDSSRAPPRA